MEQKRKSSVCHFYILPDPVTNICQEKVPRGLVRGDNVGGKVNTAAFTFSPGQHALTNIHMHNTNNTKDRKHNIKTNNNIADFSSSTRQHALKPFTCRYKRHGTGILKTHCQRLNKPKTFRLMRILYLSQGGHEGEFCKILNDKLISW